MADIMAPTLVDYLLEKYEATLDAPGSLEGFANWARDHLEENRPSTLQNVEGNYIICLMNGDEVAIAPPFKMDGSMQRSGRAIPVTGVDTAREILQAGGPMGRSRND